MQPHELFPRLATPVVPQIVQSVLPPAVPHNPLRPRPPLAALTLTMPATPNPCLSSFRHWRRCRRRRRRTACSLLPRRCPCAARTHLLLWATDHGLPQVPQSVCYVVRIGPLDIAAASVTDTTKRAHLTYCHPHTLHRLRQCTYYSMGAHRTPCARRADAVRMVGRIRAPWASVGASHPSESLDSAECAVIRIQWIHLPQNGGGNRAYLAHTPWDTFLLALVGKV